MQSSVASMIIAFCASMSAVNAAPSQIMTSGNLKVRQHDVDRWGTEVIADNSGAYCPENVIVDGACTETIDYGYYFCPDSEKIADSEGNLYCTSADADGLVCRDEDKGDYDSSYPDICTTWDTNHVLCATKSLVDGLCPTTTTSKPRRNLATRQHDVGRNGVSVIADDSGIYCPENLVDGLCPSTMTSKPRRNLATRQHDVDRNGVSVIADDSGVYCPENVIVNGACTETADASYNFCLDSEKIDDYCTTADADGLVCKDEDKGAYDSAYPDICTSWDTNHVLCATKSLVDGLCPTTA